MSRFYVTTPIYYVNDFPHIGHIYTTVVADALARYRRLAGDEVCFLTGTDEHGQNIERAAAKEGIPPLALADRVVERYHELWRAFAISNDDFIRTTEPRHARGVEELIAPPRSGRRPLPRAARGLVLPVVRAVLHREGAGGREALSGARDAGRVALGGERLLPPVALPAAAPRLAGPPPRRGRAGDPPQRGALVRRAGAARPLGVARHAGVGDPVPRPAGAHRLRLAGRAQQLHHRARLRRPAARTPPPTATSGRRATRASTWWARTSCACTRSTGRPS